MVRQPSTLIIVATTLVVWGGPAPVAQAQQTVPSYRHHGKRVAVALDTPSTLHGLTIRRPPATPPRSGEGNDSLLDEAGTRYSHIREFSPAPYTTSGVQLPFGLDGIGGYGSDFDNGAGQDSALYDNGPAFTP